MKHKILLLLATLLCSFTIAYGQTITSLADANPYKCYTIRSRHGAMSINGATFSRATRNADDAKQKFAFIKNPFSSDNTYYLYSVSEKKFVTNNNGLALSDNPGTNVVFASSGN